MLAQQDAKPTTDLYFEAHVTVDPDQSHGWYMYEVAKEYGFRPGEFLYKKTHSLAKPDEFFTARSTLWEQIYDQTLDFVITLQECGFKVRRYKIENTLLDKRL